MVGRAIEQAQAVGQNPADVLRGLVVTQDEVEHYLETTPLSGLWVDADDSALSLLTSPRADTDPELVQLMDMFDLTVLDLFILLVCLAPDIDRRFERMYAFLQDDISQRRPTVNLVMNLIGGDIQSRFAVWERLQPNYPLSQHRLIMVKPPADKPDVSAISHLVKLDERILRHLLGDRHPDERIHAVISDDFHDGVITLPGNVYAALHEALPVSPLVYMRGRPGFGQVSTAARLCDEYDVPLLVIDANKFKLIELPYDEAWRLALREAHLNEAALLINGWENLLEDDRQPDRSLWQALYHFKRPVFLCGEEDWEPLDVGRLRRMLRVAFDLPDYDERLRAWADQTQLAGIDAADDTLSDISSKFRLTRDQIARAVTTAVDIASSRGAKVEAFDLYAGVQAHVSLQLGHLAQRITPKVNWQDLVLPPEQLGQLHEIVDRARFNHIVHEQWGFENTIRGGYGISSLFAGDSGTGKTLSAQVIARELGLPLYKIDLSAVVSKYIGETEKNLNVIFTEARSSNAILFFDEADAIFGKRSEVKDARDRYANIEIAYLLQRIEDYEGIAILATNMRQNLDEAFTRRLDFLIDFPFPEAEYRLRLWQVHFPTQAPIDPSVDLVAISERYHLAGGNIRNAALASAYLAAADGGVITTRHIQNAIRREHQKMGRLLEDN